MSSASARWRSMRMQSESEQSGFITVHELLECHQVTVLGASDKRDLVGTGGNCPGAGGLA